MTLLSRIQDEVLVLKARLGQEAAFLQLVDRYHAKLLYYVRRLVGNKELADDVIQESWLAAYRQLPRLRAPQAFHVWLYRIAHTQAVSAIRTEARYVEMAEDWEPPDDTDEAEAELELSARDAARIHAALEQLPTQPREILALRFLEDMSYEEIACVLGCAVGTVKSRIHYARKALRRKMEAMQDEPIR